MVEEMTLTLNSPITDEQWDAIADVDFEHTNRIWFHTKHGKDVEFVKQKTAKWVKTQIGWKCSNCDLGTTTKNKTEFNFCPNCGAKMEVENHGTN